MTSTSPSALRAQSRGEVALRVMVADDSLLLRESIARLLEAGGMALLACVPDGEELVRAVRAAPPDVAVVDIRMPPTWTDEGLRAAAAIKSAHPEVGVLLLSQYVQSNYAVELLERGAGVGYLLKDRITDIRAFLSAVRRVAAGGTAVDEEVVAQLLQRSRARDAFGRLTERERDVLALIAQGFSNAAIGDRLFVSAKTVESHIARIFAKLDLSSDSDGHRRVLAALQWLRS